MAFIVLNTEKKLTDVLDRAFGKLSAADAKRAEAALLRANPQLADPKVLKAGALVVVPSVPGVKAPPTEPTEMPGRQVVLGLSESVADYRRALASTAKEEKAAISGLTALLKSKELKAAVRDLPSAETYLQKAAAAAKARTEENDQREAFLKALTKAKADLVELAEKLK